MSISRCRYYYRFGPDLILQTFTKTMFSCWVLGGGIKLLYFYIESLKNKITSQWLTLYFVLWSLSVVISGKATRVQFHVTVMSLDSIDEGSMVSCWFRLGSGHFPRVDLAICTNCSHIRSRLGPLYNITLVFTNHSLGLCHSDALLNPQICGEKNVINHEWYWSCLPS